MHTNASTAESPWRDFALGVLVILWTIVRLPIYALLVLLEPLIGTGLCVIGLLLVSAAFFFRFFSSLPHFPFWGMLCGGVSCVLLLMFYYLLIRLFSPNGR